MQLPSSDASSTYTGATSAGWTGRPKGTSRGIGSKYLATQVLPLEQGSHGYDIFKHKKEGGLRPVFTP
jgi:hypothetical protein